MSGKRQRSSRYEREIILEAVEMYNSRMSARLVVEKLSKKYGQQRMTNRTETVMDWVKKAKQENPTEQDQPFSIDIDDYLGDEKDNWLYHRPYKSPDGKINNPPKIDKLVALGIPEEKALQLASKWQMAYDRGDEEEARLCGKSLDIFIVDNMIPFQEAINMARLAVKAEFYNLKEALDDLSLRLEYKPWRSKVHRKAFEKVISHKISVQQSRRRVEYRSIAAAIAGNIEECLIGREDVDSSTAQIGEAIYGVVSEGDNQDNHEMNLVEVDKGKALNILYEFQESGKFPELNDIFYWEQLKYGRIGESLLIRIENYY